MEQIPDITINHLNQQNHHRWVRKWDAWAWRNEPISRQYKTTQHVRGSCVNNRWLFTYRVFAATILLIQFTMDMYISRQYKKWMELQYFTIWGQNTTTFTYCLLVVGHIFTDPTNPEDVSLNMWWKFCSWMWTMIFAWDIIITICFWTVMIPATDFDAQFEGHRWNEASLMCDHIIPLFLSIIDWCLNGIAYERQHLIVNVAIVFIYGMWNCTWVYMTGKNVYPGLNWHTFASWALGIGAMALFTAIWFFVCWCTDAKLRRIAKIYKTENEIFHTMIERNDLNVQPCKQGDLLLQRNGIDQLEKLT